MKFKKDYEIFDYSQSFSNLEPEYALAKNGRELEIVGQIDLQQKIQSFENCALNKILDKFLDLDQYLGRPNMTPSDQIYEAVNYDLADLAEIYEKAEDYKQIFGLDWNLSPNQVFDWLGKNSDQLKQKIDVYAKKMKGVEENGETKKNEEESKHSELSQNSKQSS